VIRPNIVWQEYKGGILPNNIHKKPPPNKR